MNARTVQGVISKQRDLIAQVLNQAPSATLYELPAKINKQLKYLQSPAVAEVCTDNVYADCQAVIRESETCMFALCANASDQLIRRLAAYQSSKLYWKYRSQYKGPWVLDARCYMNGYLRVERLEYDYHTGRIPIKYSLYLDKDSCVGGFTLPTSTASIRLTDFNTGIMAILTAISKSQ